jgi:hypothetical protein
VLYDNLFSRQRLALAAALLILLLFVLAGCASPPPATPVAPTAAVVAQTEPTWTAVPVLLEVTVAATEPPPPTSTSLPTSTAVPPTSTAEATETETIEPTATVPAATATVPAAATSATAAPTTAPAATAVQETQPTAAPPAEEVVLGANLLPNASFEEGHYLQNGVPELQLPNGWRLEWSEAATGLGNAAWDVYVRPEARVLSTAFLPPEEHSLYIYNGQQTVKIFKGSGAVDFQLLTDMTLQPGTYIIEAKMFADTVEKWENRQKVWPNDPTAAEFRFRVGDGGTTWTPQRPGQINFHNYTFTIDQPQTIPVGIGLRGRYAIANNGWFIDDLSLRRIE